jgi:lysozyme family protein
MAASSYDEALRRLLVHEGGYTNHPADPGGPTNFGITIYDYRKYVKPNATAADVRAMKLDDAKAIYRAKYWDAQRCDELPAGVDYAVFDYGVNSGIGRSQKVLQRCLGVAADGKIGDETIRAARAANARQLTAAICDERLRFLQGLRTWPVFGKGWGRRVAEVKAVALAMAANAPAPDVQTSSEPKAKGVVPVAKTAQQGSAGAVVAAGAAAAQQAHQAGHPLWIVACIAGLAIGAALGVWLFWHARQQKRQEKPA